MKTPLVLGIYLLVSAFGFARWLLFVLATFAGLYLYQHQWEKISEIPIVYELTDAYQRGVNSLKGVSAQAFQDFYTVRLDDQNVAIEGSPAGASYGWDAGEDGALPKLMVESTWKKERILANLKTKGFSRGKMKAAGKVADYIDRYKILAMRDMHRSKVLASIKLAQALLESGSGASGLARATNNHFGIKALPGQQARKKIKARQFAELRDQDFVPVAPAIAVHNFHDDHRYDRFEVYASVGDSYRRHTQLLTRKNCRVGKKGCYNWIWQTFPVSKDLYDITPAAIKYQPSSKIAPEDFFDGHTLVPYYFASAAGLKMAGYATSKTYHKKIAYLIETYELWRFDVDLVRAVTRQKQSIGK